MTTSNIIATSSIVEPQVLTAKTFFWSSGSSSSARRYNEKKQISNVESYLKAIGFEIIDLGHTHLTAEHGNVHVQFSYSESCNNVYKSLYVSKNGKKSNITAIRKIAAAL